MIVKVQFNGMHSHYPDVEVWTVKNTSGNLRDYFYNQVKLRWSGSPTRNRTIVHLFIQKLDQHRDAWIAEHLSFTKIGADVS